MSAAKKRMENTPFLDVWRERLRGATDGFGAKADLARFLESQGRRNLAANKNLVGWVLTGKMVPNAEDLLAMDHWIASRTARATPTRRGRTLAG